MSKPVETWAFVEIATGEIGLCDNEQEADEQVQHWSGEARKVHLIDSVRLAEAERERDEARAMAVAVDDLVSDMAGPEYTGEDEYREMRDIIKTWRKAGAK